MIIISLLVRDTVYWLGWRCWGHEPVQLGTPAFGIAISHSHHPYI